MTEPKSYTFDIKVLDGEKIGFHAITQAPRSFRPRDLESASKNISIDAKDSRAPEGLNTLLRFLLTDFFVFLHRTGLYNRQRRLWDGLARVSSATAEQVVSGIFSKTSWPCFDLSLKDSRLRKVALARLIIPDYDWDDKLYGKFLKSLLKQAEKDEGVCGLFICCKEPFPASLKLEVERLTTASDPVLRYESLLPPPVSASLNLLEMSTNIDGQSQIRLIHPDLSSKRK
jgi:hypothetical protein